MPHADGGEQPVVCDTLEDVSRQLERILSQRRKGVRLGYPACAVFIRNRKNGGIMPITPVEGEKGRNRIMELARLYLGRPPIQERSSGASGASSSTAEPKQRTSEASMGGAEGAGQQLVPRADDSRMLGAETASSGSSNCGEPPEKVQRLTSPAGEAAEQTQGVVACSTPATASPQQVAASLREISELRQDVDQLHEQNEQLRQKLAEQQQQHADVLAQMQQQHADALAQMQQQSADALAQMQQQCAGQLAQQQQQIADLQQQVKHMQQQQTGQQVVHAQQGVAAAASCVVACPPAAPVPHAGPGTASEPSAAATSTAKRSRPASQAQQQQKRPATSSLSFKEVVQGDGKQQQDAPMPDVQSTAASVAQKQQQRPASPPASHKAAGEGEGKGKQKHGAATPRAPRPRGQPLLDQITYGKTFFFKGVLLAGGGDLRDTVVKFMGKMMPAGGPWGVVDAVRRGPTACPTVVITVGTLGEADRLIQHRHKLKGSGVTLFEVLSPDERRQHAALWPAFVAARRQGKRAQFKRAVLMVEGVKVRPPAAT